MMMTMGQKYHSSLIIASGLSLILCAFVISDTTSVATIQRVGEIGSMAAGTAMIAAGILKWWWDDRD